MSPALLMQGNPVTIPWQAEEAEAGEVAQDSKDPRTSACTALPADIVMPMPLFPFLPEGEAPLSMCDISPGKKISNCAPLVMHINAAARQLAFVQHTELLHCCQSNCVCMSLLSVLLCFVVQQAWLPRCQYFVYSVTQGHIRTVKLALCS